MAENDSAASAAPTPMSLDDEMALDRVLGDDAADEMRDDVRAIAQRMRDDSSAREVVKGMQEFRALQLSAGAPTPRVLFGEVARALNCTSSRRAAVARKLAKCVPNRGTGCLKVDFYDTQTLGPNVAYLVLDECEADHDLGAQLELLYSRSKESRHKDILAHLSHLIHLGRAAYSCSVNDAATTLRQLAKKLPEGFDPLGPALVDPVNTTLYLPLPNSRRVGIFVRFE